MIPTRLLENGALEDIQVDLLPFNISYDGPAAVSTYFMRRPCPPELAQGPGELISAFRGRELHGTPIDLPAGYVGRIVKTSAPAFQQAKTTDRAAALPKKRSATSVGALVPDGKKRRTSPRKSKMTFSLDDSPTSSPTKAEPEASTSQLRVETSSHYFPEEQMVIKSESVTVVEQMQVDAEQNLVDVKRTIDLEPVNSFSTFILWSPDGVPVDRGDDPYIRSLNEWIGLSQLIHAC